MHEFDTPEPIDVDIDISVGDITIEAGERTDTVVEVRPTDAANRDDAIAAEQARVEFSAGRLLVRTTRRWRAYSPFGDGGSVDVHVRLPEGSRVSGKAAMAAFRATGALGDCAFRTALGDISVDRAGSVRLHSGAGDVGVDHALGDADLATGSGAVRVGHADGRAVVKNSNGDSRIGEITGELHVKAANGDIDVDHSGGSLSLKSANGDIRIGAAARGSIVAETGYGGVDVGIAGDTPAWLDLHTKFGHVTNGLDAGGPPQPGEDSVEVRARSGYGDIAVRRTQTGRSQA
jgi:hypothetical protein